MTTAVERYAALDGALHQLTGCAPELANGLSNHGPMAAEALCALGLGHRAEQWVRRYRTDGVPWPLPSAALKAPDVAARGNPKRATDWRRYFRTQLANARNWVDVLREAIAWLAPAAGADATHGVLRVGHAVRALGVKSTQARRDELADALAAWASGYATLGGEPDASIDGSPADAAIRRVPLLPRELRRFRGSIVSALEPLPTYEPFAPVLNLVSADEPVHRIAEMFARVYLANATDMLTTIVFIHGVTSVTAIGHLLPHLDAVEARRLLRFGWQSSAALYCAFGVAPPADDRTAIAMPPADLAQAAADHGDEHVIKFTEACLWNHARLPSASFVAAADHARRTLTPR